MMGEATKGTGRLKSNNKGTRPIKKRIEIEMKRIDQLREELRGDCRFLSSLEKIDQLREELNKNYRYLRCLRERLNQLEEIKEYSEQNPQFSMIEEHPTSVPSPTPKISVCPLCGNARDVPQNNEQFIITGLFIILAFVTMMRFLEVGGIEGAKTAWLLLGPMVALILYSRFKGR